MSIENGTHGTIKVGRNQMNIEVLHEMSDGIYQVRNLATGNVMTIAGNRITLATEERLPEEAPADGEHLESTPLEEAPAEEATPPEDEADQPLAEGEVAPTTEPTTPCHAPRHAKSLMAIALETLEAEARAMSVGEILAAAERNGLFQPEDWGKTPQQTLYGAFVRETKLKLQPRIIKSEVRGKWLLASLPEAPEVTQTAEA